MVSNQELKDRLREKKSGSNIKGYLVCDTCNGSYELKAGEKPEDYSSVCECGGKLTYNQNISPPNIEKKLSYILIVGAVLFVVIVVLFPFLILGYMDSQSSVNKNSGTSADYDELNHMTSSYDSLENQYQSLGIRVHNSNNTNLKSAYSNAQIQLENTNTTISNLNSALTTDQSQSQISNRIITAQTQLILAQKSMNNVTSMM
jgi:hypothetical protein